MKIRDFGSAQWRGGGFHMYGGYYLLVRLITTSDLISMSNAEKINQACCAGKKLETIEILCNLQLFNSIRGLY